MGKAGRPAAGEHPINIPASTKITSPQRDLLVSSYGSIYRGLQVAVEELEAKEEEK